MDNLSKKRRLNILSRALVEEVPLLLGRADVFNLFDICFKRNKKTVFVD